MDRSEQAKVGHADEAIVSSGLNDRVNRREIKGYQNKIANKYETERKIKKNDYFEKNHGHLALALNQINMLIDLILK